MRTYRNHIIACLFLVLSVFLMGADGGARNGDETATLLESRRMLLQKIETLRREQDYLLFRKAMYEADSKYLVLNVTGRTGQLMYKNRVLKTFPFFPSRRLADGSMLTGKLALTEKVDGKRGRFRMLFGTDLVMQTKQAAAPQRKTKPLALSLAKKDMQSVYSAIEQGALAYIVR